MKTDRNIIFKFILLKFAFFANPEMKGDNFFLPKFLVLATNQRLLKNHYLY